MPRKVRSGLVGKDAALQDDVVADFPFVFLAEINVDDAGRASRFQAASWSAA